MITNKVQLEVALHQLNRFHEMLEAMRVHLKEQNSSLFPTVAEGYLARIRQLEKEIIDYTYHLLQESEAGVSVLETTNSKQPQQIDVR
jgi:hypothetical protein